MEKTDKGEFGDYFRTQFFRLRYAETRLSEKCVIYLK